MKVLLKRIIYNMSKEPFYWSFDGINESVVFLANKLLEHGIKREMNGFQATTSAECYEMPGPVVIEITDPTSRQILIPERKWNKILPMAESLWMLLGSNDLDDLPGHFVKSIYNFSDDGHTWRGGYSPRLRGYTGISTQYYRSLNSPLIQSMEKGAEGSYIKIDQLQYVVETLKREPTSRQALITVHDPAKDSQLGLVTKDIPCTRSLHFMIVDGKLNLYTWMRSNDFRNGYMAVNVYNFTLTQQYVAKILKVPVGSYWHIVDNFHYYGRDKELIETLSKVNMDQAKEYDSSLHNDYDDYISSLEDLDDMAKEIYDLEEQFWWISKQTEPDSTKITTLLEYIQASIQDPFFRGWAYAFPLAMKSIRKIVKSWLVENGESENKMIAQFF